MARRTEPGPTEHTTGRLLRQGEEPRVPWLEPEDDGFDDEPGFDPRRALVVLLVALAALAAIGAGLVWLLGRNDGDAIVADGSVIEAPDAPYKVRPADPGGTQVAGTGDVSFEVAEGVEHVGRIAGAGQGAIDEGEAGGIGVQIGAYASKEEASAGWQQLSGRIPALQGRGHRILEGSADAGTVFRLQALAGDGADAAALCQAIVAEGGDCQVKH